MTKSVTLYGIKNCDTVKKAIKWLNSQSIEFNFHDFRQDGCDESLIKHFLANADWNDLINKRSTSFRQLTDDEKAQIDIDATMLVIAQPTLIKRPVLTVNDAICSIGFSDKNYDQIFN